MTNIQSLFFYTISFAISVLLYDLSNKKNNKFLKLLALMIPILIGGLRYKVGTDYMNYIDYYDTFKRYSINQYLSMYGIGEILSFGIVKISFLLTNSSSLMFFLTNLIIILFNAYFIKKIDIKEKSLLYAAFLFTILPFSWNGIRQSIAVAISICSIALILNLEKKKGILYALIPVLFHNSGIITLPFAFYFSYLVGKKNKIAKEVVKVTIFLIISIVGGYFVIDKLPFLAGYARYSNINIESNNYMFFLKLLMLFIFIYCRKGLFKDKTNIYFFMMFIVDIIFTGLGFISPVLKRINLYFGIYSIILLIKIINLGYDKYSKSWLNLFVILYILIYFFIIYFMLGQSHIFPYNFIQI